MCVMHECMWRVHVCMCVQVYVCVVCDMYLIVYVQLVGENLCVYGIQGVHVGGWVSIANHKLTGRAVLEF